MNKKENQKEMDNQPDIEVDNNLENEVVPTEDISEQENVKKDELIEENEPVTKKKKVKKKKEISEIDRISKELGEMKDKYLRIFAEFDNYRKRTIKERQDIIKLASRDALNAILPAVDDFDRAIKVAAENENEADIPEGIILIYTKLFKALEQQGIKEMISTGQDFDPELHEALTKIPAPSDELKGKVIDTIEKGFYLNDKIIRYAKVVVGE
jgi:molecular chaperone GrpE